VLIRTLPHGVALAVAGRGSRGSCSLYEVLVAPLIRRIVLVLRLRSCRVGNRQRIAAEFKTINGHVVRAVESINGLPAAIAPETVPLPVGVIRTKV